MCVGPVRISDARASRTSGLDIWCRVYQIYPFVQRRMTADHPLNNRLVSYSVGGVYRVSLPWDCTPASLVSLLRSRSPTCNGTLFQTKCDVHMFFPGPGGLR